MTAAQIARELGGKRSGAGYVAKCPAHRDSNPSLSISQQAGTLLVHCHAGCEQHAVVDALKGMGLWPEAICQNLTDAPTPVRTGTRGPICQSLADTRIVATYDYTDESGNLLYQVVRFEPKGFKQRRPDGAGGWRWGIEGVRRVPYRLPELIEAAIVFVAEGEKDCEALRVHGFAATCNSGGAGKWQPEFNKLFVGKEVCILPDADAPGWNHALDIARGIVGIAAKVQLLELPGAKDAAEWFSLGHSELELIELVEAPCHQ